MFVDSLVGIALLDYQQEGVVAGYGSQHGGEVVLVNVVGDASGIARTGLDDGNVGREADGDKSSTHLMLVLVVLTVEAFVEGDGIQSGLNIK